MKDEIKEIIELINTNYKDYYIDDFLSGEDIKKLVDYITNLQEENDYLKDIVSNTELSNEIKKADKWSKRELYKINYQRLKANQRLLEENEILRKERDKNLNNVMFLSKVCDEKQERIDKAIEYIKNDWYELNTRDIEHCINLNKDIRIDLLNILQGENDDRRNME